MNTPEKPDYGEPWKVGSIHKPLLDCYGHDPLLLHRTTKRIIQCVNACAGMADPAEEIQAMRGAIKEAHDALDGCREDTCELIAERDWWKDEPRCGYAVRYQEIQSRLTAAESAITKLQPFLAP